MRPPNFDAEHILEAEQILKEVTASYPDYAEAWAARGIVESALMRSDEALRCWNVALALKPGYAEVHGDIGAQLAQENDWEGAIEEFHRGLEIRDDIPILWINLCIAYAKTGKMKEAQDAYRRAAELSPNHAQLWRCLFNLRQRTESAKMRLESTKLRIRMLEMTPPEVLALMPDEQFLDLW